jgi:predicted phage-related endonuclease
MRFTVINAPQRSPEWFTARLGRLTGSAAADMLSAIKSGEAAARRDLRTRLVCERLTGLPQEDAYTNAAMQRGIDCEPLALAAYEAQSGHLVQATGFLSSPDLMIGCSLDGHVGNFVGIVEAKCPKSSTHLRYLHTGGVPAEYLPQIRHNLCVTGAEWCDFVSWDDRFPAHLETFIARVYAKDLDIAGYEKKARAFLAEVDAAVESLACVGDQLRASVAQIEGVA